MYYPIDQSKAISSINLKIKALELDKAMLDEVLASLQSFARKNTDKFMLDHIKANTNASISNQSTDYVLSFLIIPNDRVLKYSTPDANGVQSVTYRDNLHIYPHKPCEGMTSVDSFKKAVSSRIEGITSQLVDLEKIRVQLPVLIKRYDQAAKVIDEIGNLAGMYSLRDFFPGLR